MLWSPATYKVFKLAGGADGVGVGVPLAWGEGDDDGDDEAFGDDLGEGDDVGFGDAAASGWAAMPFAAVSSRAPEACPVPPDLVGLGLELEVDLGVDLGVDDGFPLDDGFGVGVGVGVGTGVVGVLDAAPGKPAPAGLSPGWHRALVGITVVQSSTCRNLSWAALSSGWIWLALLPGIEMLMNDEPCCCTVVLLMPSPLKRLSRIEIAVFMSVLVGTPPLAATAWSVTEVPPCRSRPRPTLNCLCQCEG